MAQSSKTDDASKSNCDTNEDAMAMEKSGYTNKAFDGNESAYSNSYIMNNYAAKATDTSPPIVLCSSASSPTIADTLDFDDILPHIGEFGTYQKILFFLMIPFAFFVAFVYFTQIFITLVPEKHWCQIPELSHLTIEQRWVNRKFKRNDYPFAVFVHLTMHIH